MPTEQENIKKNNKKTMKKFLSYTQISMLLKCPRQYFFRYIEGIKTPVNLAMATSSAWHAANQRFLVNRLPEIGKPDLSVEEIQADFERRYNQALLTDNIELETGEDTGQTLDYMMKVIPFHYDTRLRHIKPIAVEKEFRISLGDEFPYDLKGKIDYIDTDDCIGDHKLSSKTPSQTNIDNDLQFSCYSLGHRVVRGKPETCILVDHIIKNKTPKFVQFKTYRTNADCRWLLKLIETLVDQICKDVFPPNPTGWWCGKKYCKYYDKCQPHRVNVSISNTRRDV